MTTFSKKQRELMPICYNPKTSNGIRRKNHAWKKGKDIFHECGICGVCGYDAYDDTFRIVPDSDKVAPASSSSEGKP